MPRRGDRPGLKRGRNNLPYWIARQVVRDPMGFPDLCIPLPTAADDEQLGVLCREHTARLLAWIAEQRGEQRTEIRPRGYDGTVQSACRAYQEHPNSRFHSVKANTRKSYTDSLKIIEGTVGRRIIRKVTVLDVQRWYDEWRKPARPGLAERIDRAHDAVAMLKMVLRFNAALRRPDCRELVEDLERATSLVRFERRGARQQEMTSAHAGAFIKTALELGRKDVIPVERGLSMAIGVAAQFELALRQKDIIGEWRADGWHGQFTWENVPGWRWRMRTSKSKYRSAAIFNLSLFGLLFPLLDSVPHEQRQGAIVKGEHGLPIRERSYRKWFRQIARAAGIPDDIWSMDSRAGAATEADEAGVPLSTIREALTHADDRMTERYLRERGKKIAEVAEARGRLRANTSETPMSESPRNVRIKD